MLIFGETGSVEFRALAEEAFEIQQHNRGSGLQIIELLIADEDGNSISGTEQVEWASQYAYSTIPVLDDDNQTIWRSFEHNDQTPTIVHLDGQMIVLSVDEGIESPQRWIE